MQSLEKLADFHPYYSKCLSDYGPLNFKINDGIFHQFAKSALAALHGRDPAKALRQLAQAEIVQVVQSDTVSLNILRALAFIELGDCGKALDVLSSAIVLEPVDSDLRLFQARALIGLKRFEDAAEAFRGAFDRNDRCGPAVAALAAMHGMVENWSEALHMSNRARELGAEIGPRLVFLTNLFARVALGESQQSMDLTGLGSINSKVAANLPVVTGDLRAKNQHNPIVFTACDGKYLCEYLPALAYSLEEQGEPLTLHIHLYDPDQKAIELVNLISNRLRLVTISTTAEQLPSNMRDIRVYFSCVRFVRAWELLCENDVPILIVDTDALLNQPLSKFPGMAADDTDVTICTPEHSPPWEEVLAGAVLLKQTSCARVWLGTVAALIADNLNGDMAIWFLDQISLSIAAKRNPARARLLRVPSGSLVDIHHSDAAFVWAVTVDKMKESRFLCRTRELLAKYGSVSVQGAAGYNPNEIVKSDYGFMLINQHDMYIGPSIKATGRWCQVEIDLMARFIRPGDTVFDIGANFGYHTLAFSRLVGPQGRVHSFEPQRLVWQNLVASLALNWISNVNALNVAVGDKSGVIRVPPISYIGRNNIGALSLVENWHGNQEVEVLPDVIAETVPIFRLDEFGAEACRLVKIDVEGMELSVLEGAASFIERLRPVCYVEFHSNRDAIANFFARHGYRLFFHDVPFNPNLVCLPDWADDLPQYANLVPITPPMMPAQLNHGMHATSIAEALMAE